MGKGNTISRYIKDNSLTFGFNPECGQTFFDYLNDQKYRRYIHSYYFGIDRNRKYDLYKDLGIDVLKILEECDTYDIPGNLLFNAYGDGNIDSSKLDKIKQCMNICNLDAITILIPEDAILVKDRYPDIKVHLSVRYFDDPEPVVQRKIDRLFRSDTTDYIDVINISGIKSYNDHELIKEIHNRNALVKYIIDEGCVLNRDVNYCQFPGCEEKKCIYKDPTMDCRGAIDLYNWLSIATSCVYKEQLQYYDIDILKFASRDYSLEAVRDSLEFWTTNKHTKDIYGNFGQYTSMIDIPTHYDEFLEWCKFRSTKCTGFCYTCRICEEYFNKMLNECFKK